MTDYFSLSLVGKIKNLLPDGTLDSSTILVLVNAIYFKAEWDQKFYTNKTKEAEFWLTKVLSIFIYIIYFSYHI